MTLPAGARLGSYEVLALLGVGGMGEVYHARDLKLGRHVAIKILREDLARDADRIARFDREARLLAALNHPLIATLYGVEEAAGEKFLVMEFVPGATLAEVLAARPIPVEEALALGCQVAEALEAAHEQGIVHRDLKPANIKVTPQNKVKLLDFGLAKAVLVSNTSSAETVSQGHTREGTLLGTPAYMSPEQTRAQALDRRTDIWSFGCLLFEALTGQRPFAGNTPADIFVAILEREPDWRVLPADTPAAIQNLLQRCLRKDLARRLRDIGDARLEILEAIDPDRPDQAPTSRWAGPAVSAPPSLPSTVALSNATLAPGWEQMQKGVFVTRLRRLQQLRKRYGWFAFWSVWAALVLSGMIGWIVGEKTSVRVADDRPMEFGIAWGISSGTTLFAGMLFASWLWRRRVMRRQIQSILKNHPGEMQSWGGEATLLDPVAVEGVLHTIGRQS